MKDGSFVKQLLFIFELRLKAMTTLTIQIPDKKAALAKQILKELGATFVIDKQKKRVPNPETIEAINELKEGKSKEFNSAKELFSSF